MERIGIDWRTLRWYPQGELELCCLLSDRWRGMVEWCFLMLLVFLPVGNGWCSYEGWDGDGWK
jgi:hypothetical protein